MTFAPQCKTRADLHREMARVLDMCEEAGFGRPWECVRYRGIAGPQRDFDDDTTQYEFAIAIVEGRPVFRGDDLYFIDTGEQFTAGGWDNDFNSLFVHGNIGISFTPDRCSWNPPQRTIEINGVKVKAPEDVITTNAGYELNIIFDEPKDAEAFKAALEGKK